MKWNLNSTAEKKYFAEKRKAFLVMDIATQEEQKTSNTTGISYRAKTKIFRDAQHIHADDFLRLPLYERLPLISSPPVFSEELHKGDTIHFDFHGNKELEQTVSLSEVLPKTVRKVSIGKNVASRDKITSEYHTESEKRLSVHQGTLVKIEEAEVTRFLKIRKEEMLQRAKNLKLGEFLDMPFSERLQLITENAQNLREPQKDDILMIHFHGNTDLESQIGLDDALPERISVIEVIDNSGRKTVGKRSSSGFFVNENEQRLVIHTGFLVKILK